VLSFVKGCVHLSFDFFSKMICYSETNYLLTSPRNIGVHNSILEYVSNTSISLVLTMPFHVKPFERKFLKKWFSPQISSKPLSPQETEHIRKREGKRKAQRVSLNKRGSQYFERRKIFQLQKSFLMWFPFLPLHHTISKTLSKIIEKIFFTLFWTIL
jgi:hypothetical protein